MQRQGEPLGQPQLGLHGQKMPEGGAGWRASMLFVDSSTPEAGVAAERAARVVRRIAVKRMIEVGWWLGTRVCVYMVECLA
jgi:hypothetical protein